jgi:FtsZ-binding cell division protein ZapB
MREALQRAEVNGSNSEGVIEKVKGVVEELTGFEADTETVENPEVSAINAEAREIRKFIYASKAEIGGASVDILQQIKKKIDGLVDAVYILRQKEECPTCKIKRLEEEEQEPQEKPLDLSEYGKTASEKRRQLMEEIRSELGQ